MIEAPFGIHFIEVDIDKKTELEDLSNAPTNAILLGLINDQCVTKHAELRSSIEEGNVGRAQIVHGYLQALEDVSEMLSKGLGESLKSGS